MSAGIQAQFRSQYGLLPAININKKVNPQYKLNFKLEGRQRLYQQGEATADYQLTDMALVLARRVGLDHNLAGGYLIRFQDGQRIHRFIQQWSFEGGFTNLGLVHRFVLDQTFTPEEATQFRLRYRAAIQLPLSGQSLNERELYLKMSNEYLGELQAAEYDLEIRLVLALGFHITDNNKIELGLDNRLDAFLQDQGRLRSWSILSWYRAF